MGKAKRKIERNRVETIPVTDKQKQKKVKNVPIKKYLNIKWFRVDWKNILVIGLAFFGSAFLVAYPLSLAFNNFKVAYVFSQGVVTSFIIVLYNSRGEQKHENILEFFVRWIMVGVVLTIVSLFAV